MPVTWAVAAMKASTLRVKMWRLTNPDKYRAYQKALMQKLRAKKAAEAKAAEAKRVENAKLAENSASA